MGRVLLWLFQVHVRKGIQSSTLIQYHVFQSQTLNSETLLDKKS